MPDARDARAARDAWVGAVLTGGASTRMGKDKAAIEIDGVPMAARVADALRRAGAADVALVGGAAGDVADDHPGAGPLGGVLTALRWSTAPVTVVAPCDLLRPTPALFDALVEGLDDASVAAVPAADRPLPLALRTAATVGPLRAAFADGERSLRGALARLPGVVVVALDDAALADVDTPADLPGHPGR